MQKNFLNNLGNVILSVTGKVVVITLFKTFQRYIEKKLRYVVTSGNANLVIFHTKY